MTRVLRRLTGALGVAMAAALAGCPPGPSLFVTPLSLSFPANGADTQTLRISNTGGGTLTWTATENLPWLALAAAPGGTPSDTVQGSTAKDVAVISVNVNRALLQRGANQGVITIASNGGTVQVPVSANQPGDPVLSVTPATIDFGSRQTEIPLTVRNTGEGRLDWSFTVAPGAPWLSISPASGSLANPSETAEVTVRVNRAGLGGGEFSGSLNAASNGGNTVIAVAMRVSPFSMEPDTLDFGSILTPATQSLSLRNNSDAAVQVQFSTSTTEDAPWLSLATNAVNLPTGTGVTTVDVTANPALVGPGDYTGTIIATNPLTGFEETTAVTMRVSGLALAPALVDFGEITAPDSRIVQLTNLGAAPIPFTVSVAPASPWLAIAPTTGTVNTTTALTVSVNPAVVPAGDYTATATVAFAGGTASFEVRMSTPEPASLKVEPSTIDFGTSQTNLTVGIWNPGIGTVNWSIDTAAFPDWLSIAPVNAQGVASGTVSGDQTDAISVRVNRALAPDDVEFFAFTFNVAASGDATTPVPVTVRMTKPRIPRIVVLGDGLDINGNPFINFDTQVTERPVIVRNEGNGPLSWNFDLSGKPSWITSISPSQGSLNPGVQTTVTVTVSRANLTFLGAQTTLSILSNDPDAAATPLRVEVQVAKRRLIGTRQNEGFAFGLNANAGVFEVGNIGDPETILDYQISSSKEWLAIFPETGTSVGTATPLKDWRPHSIAVDRSLLEGSGASAIITVRATRTENGVRVPDPTVAPLQVTVTVEAATLTIQGGIPRTRIPSLVRNVLLLRNIRYQALPIPGSLLDDVAQRFTLSENSVPLEATETNQFLRDANRTRTNALILLDYSGSMRDTALQLAADGQLGDGVTPLSDPVQAMYEQAIPLLIDELPETYNIALAVFSERTPSGFTGLRLLTSGGGPTFTRDKTLLQARLANANVVDNGATQLLEAVAAGARLLQSIDTAQGLIPFDDADVRALICVTDGRITTVTQSTIADTADLLQATGTRFFAIGFGNGVASNPLLRLAGASGGHYYSTRTQPTAELDPFGQPVRKPLLSELVGWCSTDPLDECDQSIPKDLASQVVLSYTTLLQESGVGLEARLTFNDPNDQDSPCLPEQGQITGAFRVDQMDYFAIEGDVRLGQISLRTDGIQPDGSATVVARLEYAPRNVSRFVFDIAPAQQVAIIPESRGGAISGWTQSVNGNRYTFTAPDNRPLQYGDFGDLIELRFSNTFAPFTLAFEVVSPERNDGPDAKYFTHPDTIPVGSGPFLATAFPRAFIDSIPPVVQPGDPNYDEARTTTIDLGTTFTTAQINLFNRGGSYVRPGGIPNPLLDVGYAWTPVIEADAAVFRVDPLDGGFVTSTTAPDPITVTVDRCVPPGVYFGTLILQYNFGAVNFGGLSNPIYIRYDVPAPSLAVSTNLIDFGTSPESRFLTITNNGQGALNWTYNGNNQPNWLLTPSAVAGIGCPGAPDTIRFDVNRTNYPAGTYEHTVFIQGIGLTPQAITIRMSVP